MVRLLLLLPHLNRAKRRSKKISCGLQGSHLELRQNLKKCYSYDKRSHVDNISWIDLQCSCICKYIGRFWWREKGSRWETTTTTTRPTSIHFTVMLIINHKLNNTIASRMFILVGLHFSMIEIGHLCVEIHLHDPWKARERGRKDVNNSSSTQNALEPAIEISPYDL